MEVHLYKYNPWWEEDIDALNQLLSRADILPNLMKQFNNAQIVFLTGIRRVGKSSLMKLCIKELIQTKNINPSHILYISLDDFLL